MHSRQLRSVMKVGGSNKELVKDVVRSGDLLLLDGLNFNWTWIPNLKLLV